MSIMIVLDAYEGFTIIPDASDGFSDCLIYVWWLHDCSGEFFKIL